MTNLEAITAKLNYPLTSNAFTLVLEDRALASSGTYSKCQAFDLAYADAITMLVTAPGVTEGGYQVSLSDKASLLKIADGIYTKYDETISLSNSSLKKTATFVQRF